MTKRERTLEDAFDAINAMNERLTAANEALRRDSEATARILEEAIRAINESVRNNKVIRETFGGDES